jgi:hypothetical protein
MPVLKIKKADGSWQEVWGCISTGVGGSIPKLTSITMLANAWEGSQSPYSQVVTCNGVNVNSKLDLQPNPSQIVELQNSETTLMVMNLNGTVTAYAIGTIPNIDYEMNVLITEVAVV